MSKHIEIFKQHLSRDTANEFEGLVAQNADIHWRKKAGRISLHLRKKLRNEGLKQTDLAEMLNVSPQQVNKWLKGKENLKLETIAKLEQALNIELIKVTSYKEEVKTIFSEQKVILNPKGLEHFMLKVGENFLNSDFANVVSINGPKEVDKETIQKDNQVHSKTA